MSTQEYIAKLDKQLSQMNIANLLLTSVTEAHARQVNRIFVLGISGNGEKIGQYDSTHPLYVDPNTSPKKFPLKGKTGSDTFKSGKSHKTGYFDSYKAFRAAIQRETGFVNLRLTENLKFDFTNSLELSGNVYVTGVKRKENTNKVDGLSKKYGASLFKLTQGEKTIYLQSVKKKFFDTLNN